MKNSGHIVGITGLWLLLACSALADTHYVWTNSPSPASPFTSWTTAARDIQSAIDVSEWPDVILVANGVYATGERIPRHASLKNRIVIDRAVTVRSVNGPSSTFIVGKGPLGNGAVRCVYLADEAVLDGFTLTNGFTLTFSDAEEGSECSGGGAIGTSAGGSGSTLNNCVLSGNSAGYKGGGAYGTVLNNCIVSGNTADWGGGAFGGYLNSCTLSRNRAYNGSGTCHARVSNCTIVSNDCTGGWMVGGVFGGKIYNSIVYGNQGDNYFPDYSNVGGSYWYSDFTFENNCTTPDPGGIGNITNDPLFVDAAAGDYRLCSASPCIDGGNNAYVSGANDLDGKPRIVCGAVDIGAYEYVGFQVNNASGATNVTTNSGRLNGNVYYANGAPIFVRIYWGTMDGGTNATAWSNVVNLGVMPVGPFSTNITGLAATTPYYYRCWASNSTGIVWARNTANFATVGSPIVNNDDGASGIAATFATLNGGIVSTGGLPTSVHIYWGVTDGGPNSGAWSNRVACGVLPVGPFSGFVTGLTYTSRYYYRCSASNSAGIAWAPATTSFLTMASFPVVNNGSGAINVTATSAVLNGSVTSTGGAPTSVRIFWGLTDGGTDVGAWSNCEDIGAQTICAILTNITGLARGTLYYYRSWASNSVGVAWADASTNFTTGLPPAIDNSLGATGLTGSSAILNGNLISTGSAPTVTV